ncbi:hypothetical protein MA16_Dca018252 [Dendrobium catenatum]|uniref:Uncharacterized protein n=1 Tax=Dendrobium catenatum TaxID=906689 RepID=A0A2I0XBB7_9ASPA|nr:hypothetical protein MA16_Dca018252 [Dendrobium catenatum]
MLKSVISLLLHQHLEMGNLASFIGRKQRKDGMPLIINEGELVSSKKDIEIIGKATRGDQSNDPGFGLAQEFLDNSWALKIKVDETNLSEEVDVAVDDYVKEGEFVLGSEEIVVDVGLKGGVEPKSSLEDPVKVTNVDDQLVDIEGESNDMNLEDGEFISTDYHLLYSSCIKDPIMKAIDNWEDDGSFMEDDFPNLRRGQSNDGERNDIPLEEGEFASMEHCSPLSKCIEDLVVTARDNLEDDDIDLSCDYTCDVADAISHWCSPTFRFLHWLAGGIWGNLDGFLGCFAFILNLPRSLTWLWFHDKCWSAFGHLFCPILEDLCFCVGGIKWFCSCLCYLVLCR